MHFIVALCHLAFSPPLVVDLPCPGAAARVIATEVAPLLEAAAKNLAGVERVATTSTPGRCRLFVDLKADAGRAKVRGQLAEHLKSAKWPAWVKQPSIILQPDLADEAELVLLTSTGQHDAVYLSALADHLRTELARLPGVGEVTTTGGRGFISCNLDLDRLAAFNLGLREVADGLRAVLAKRPGAEGTPPLAAVANLEDAVIATKAGQEIRLREVARVELGRQGQAAAGFLTAGSPPTETLTVGIWLRPQPGQADAVRQALKTAWSDLKKQAPEGVTLTPRSLAGGQTVFRLQVPTEASDERRIDQARQVGQTLATDSLAGSVLWINEQPEMLVVPWPAKEGTKLDLSSARRRLLEFPAVRTWSVAGNPAHPRPGEGQPLQVLLFGSGPAELAAAADLVRGHLVSLPIVEDLRQEPGPPHPELAWVPDLTKARTMGLMAEDLECYLQAVRGPLPVGQLNLDGRKLDVALVLPTLRAPDELAKLSLFNKQGQRIPWANLVATQYVSAEPLVYRVNGQECHVVSAHLDGNHQPNSLAAVLEKLKSQLPAGVRLEAVLAK